MANTNFLQNRAFFLLTLGVLFTTVFSWFNLNSLCIILLLACRLFWGWKPLTALRTAFGNRLFLSFLIFSVIEAAGIFHTHDAKAGADVISKDATLVAIAFVFCAGPFADEGQYRRMMTAYCGMIFAACVYCLIVAWRYYQHDHDPGDFLYHPLTRPISHNAVFYSVYVLFAMQYLLSRNGSLAIGVGAAGARKALRIGLVVFFLLMIVLLSSKLVLIVAVLLLAASFLRQYSFRRNKKVLLIGVCAVVTGIGLLAATNNPIRARYLELAQGDIHLVSQPTFDPGIYFTALQLRLLEYRFAREIMQEHQAWLLGVSPGDSQDLLDQKYVTTNMYIGNPADGPHRHIRGFIGYNFHNQYLETLVRDGLLGLISLLSIFWLLGREARRQRSTGAAFVILTLAVFFIPEAPLTMQHGIFLFCFFPLAALYGRAAAKG